MNTVNLYVLTRLNANLESYVRYEQNLASLPVPRAIKEHERRSLLTLVDLLYNQTHNIEMLDGFVCSYSIPHIGKEFDLLRVSRDEVLNIELKSDEVPLADVKSQLSKNAYYLGPLKRAIHLYAFFEHSRKVYRLNNSGALDEVSLGALACCLQKSIGPFASEYDALFSEHKYLVSPVNDRVAFLEHHYFLTQQQLQIKNLILKDLSDSRSGAPVYKIAGAAGTGKTLLLFDLARSLSGDKRSLVVHCGVMQKGHMQLNQSQNSFRVVPIKDISTVDFASYGAILLDESHRCRVNQLNLLIKKARGLNIPVIFCLDKAQTINRSEIQADIAGKLDAQVEKSHSFELSKKIRNNPEIAAFVRELFSLRGKDYLGGYGNIDILFASNEIEALDVISHFQIKGYQFISYTPSQYTRWAEDIWCTVPNSITSHEAIGQEFDKVILPMSDCFFFQDGRLMASVHPYHNYLMGKMLFQGMTRAVSKLAILVYKNIALVDELTAIVNNTRKANIKDNAS